MNANGRRARQAKNGFNHWAKKQRPGFKRRDIGTAIARSERKLQAERERKARGAKQ